MISTSLRIKISAAFLAGALVATGGSCAGSEDRQLNRPIAGDINPGEVRAVCTVVGIDSTRTARAGDPCSTYPCFATIRIDSVLGYGSGFPRPLSAGESISARFAFTLAPSNEAMPNIATPLPGLEEGDAFMADIRVHPTPGAGTGTGDPKFVVYDYVKRLTSTR